MSVLAIRSYIRLNSRLYAEYFSDLIESFLFLSSLRFTIIVGLVLSNISNFSRTHDPLNLIVNIPSELLLLIYPTLRRKKIIPQGQGTIACFVLMLLLSLQWSFSFWVFVKNDVQLLGPTVITLVLSMLWIFSLGPSILLNILKACVSSFVFLGIMYAVDPAYVLSIKGSLFTGLLLGFGLNQSIDQMLRFRFYSEEQQKMLLEKNTKIELVMRTSNVIMFSIDQELQLHAEFSADVARLFGTEAEAVHLDGLLSLSDLSAADKTAMKAALQAMIGDSDISFAINEHGLAKRFHLQTLAGGSRTMQASYAPLPNEEGRIHEILLAINDVTDLEQQESRQRIASMEAESLLVLLRAPREQLELFMNESQRILRELVRPRSPAELLRSLHTFKGNSRTLGFKALSQLVHEAEGSIESGTGFDSSRLAINTVLELLLSVYHERFQVHQEPTHFAGFLENLARSSAEQISQSLQKPTPKIHIDCPSLPDSPDLRQLMFQILPHLLANALDHGIESAEDRTAIGKTPFGNIYFEFSGSDIITFRCRDDGRGLALDALRTRLAALAPGRHFTDQDVAQSILTYENSTRQSVSEISGRGVGMSAVYEAVGKQKGRVLIVLGNKAAPGYRQFTLELQIPSRHINIKIV